MIVTIGIYIVSIFIGLIALILPDLHVWPTVVHTSIQSFFGTIIKLDSAIFFIDILLNAFVFFLRFLTYFFIYKITIKVLNYFRGVGSGLN